MFLSIIINLDTYFTAYIYLFMHSLMSTFDGIRSWETPKVMQDRCIQKCIRHPSTSSSHKDGALTIQPIEARHSVH
jgi:hypothetical protein